MPWDRPAEFLITQTFEDSAIRFPGARPKYMKGHIQCINWFSDQAGPAQFVSGQGGEGRLLRFGRDSEFLVEHWDQLNFKTIEANGEPVEFDSNFRLLEVEIPERLIEKYREAKGDQNGDQQTGKSVMTLILDVNEVKPAKK